MEISYPQLYSFAKSENITLQSVLAKEELYDLLNLPLPEEAYLQYCELEIMLQTINASDDKEVCKELLKLNWSSRPNMAQAGASHRTHQETRLPFSMKIIITMCWNIRLERNA
jgi:hypothetical protein